MVGLNADAEYTALAHGIAAARYIADLGRGEDQVFVAHQLRYGRRHFRRNPPGERLQVRFRRLLHPGNERKRDCRDQGRNCDKSP